MNYKKLKTKLLRLATFLTELFKSTTKEYIQVLKLPRLKINLSTVLNAVLIVYIIFQGFIYDKTIKTFNNLPPEYKIMKKVRYKEIIKEVPGPVVKQTEETVVYKTKIKPVYVDKELKLTMLRLKDDYFVKATVGGEVIKEQQVQVYDNKGLDFKLKLHIRYYMPIHRLSVGISVFDRIEAGVSSDYEGNLAWYVGYILTF